MILSEKTKDGLKYSLVERAKENKLKIYEYLKHLLTEIPKHMEATSLDFLEALTFSKKSSLTNSLM